MTTNQRRPFPRNTFSVPQHFEGKSLDFSSIQKKPADKIEVDVQMIFESTKKGKTVRFNRVAKRN